MACLPPTSESGALMGELVILSLTPGLWRPGSVNLGKSCWAIRKTTLWLRARCPAIREGLELVELQGASGHLQEGKEMGRTRTGEGDGED